MPFSHGFLLRFAGQVRSSNSRLAVRPQSRNKATDDGMRQTSAKRGFTLVEVLVVITIIGILIALLLPAVQAAREAARKVQCSNNIKQMALACLQHEESNKFLPSGGWGWTWAGDPDRGYSKRQPGGWHFNILSYMGLDNLHDMALGQNHAAAVVVAETPIGTFICPTRRQAIAYAFPHPTNYNTFPRRPQVVGRSDYAANAGDATTDAVNPQISAASGTNPYATGDGMADAQWTSMWYGSGHPTGVVFRRSQCTMADIPDGASNTYLIGERYCWPDHYDDGVDFCDDQGWVEGYDYDTNRWVQLGSRSDPNSYLLPMQDTPGRDDGVRFGSAHASGFNMSFCDGSVQWISYAIDAETHRCLGNREDGLAVDPKKL
jgi:prepilin-type N-terminal cleavage/methylation domain-containing protein/prepilin-type processing-associated H-X9-DG protein